MGFTVSAKSAFEPCPEYQGRAVCVDVTPLQKTASKFGDRDTFRIVFEIDQAKGSEGERWTVWSGQMTPTLNEKANLRKFLGKWFGRDLTAEELKSLDLDSLIGKPAYIVVVHEHKDSETYANIAVCTPHKAALGDPLPPTGKFVRKKDRPEKGGSQTSGSSGSGGADYRKTAAPETQQPTWQQTKVHVGKFTGQQLADLPEEAIVALQEKWLPNALSGAKLTADDNRLKNALEEYHKFKNPPPAETTPADNLEY